MKKFRITLEVEKDQDVDLGQIIMDVRNILTNSSDYNSFQYDKVKFLEAKGLDVNDKS